ncbi:hypothetical protein C8R46DRAFT_1234876 [Mycena filopes]|nr:hypothetical protein C8R46DRAFT_1234876 [Mycena filopes]
MTIPDNAAPPGSTGKIRPCLVVHVNKSKKEVHLAPFTSAEALDHPGWTRIWNDPKITNYGSSLIWIGGPAVTPVILGSVREMYWLKGRAAYDVEGMRVNLANYRLRRKEYIAKHGTNDEAILAKVVAKRAKSNPQGSAAHSGQSSVTIMSPPANVSQQQGFRPIPMRQGAYPEPTAFDPTALAFIPRANQNVAPLNFSAQSFAPQVPLPYQYQVQMMQQQQEQYAQASHQQQIQAMQQQQQQQAYEARLTRWRDQYVAQQYAAHQSHYDPARIFQDAENGIWYYTRSDGLRGPQVVTD